LEKGPLQQIPDNELVIAIAITIAIDGDDAKAEVDKIVSVHATEYDPDSKPPLYKNRRCRLYGLGGCCVFVGLLNMFVSISATNNNTKGGNDSGSDDPSKC
jgi:hypothetical protein